MFVEMPQTNDVAYNGLNQAGYGAPGGGIGLRDQMVVEAVNGVASGVGQSATQAIILEYFGDGGGGGVTVDESLCYDGGYGGTDGGYSGGNTSY